MKSCLDLSETGILQRWHASGLPHQRKENRERERERDGDREQALNPETLTPKPKPKERSSKKNNNPKKDREREREISSRRSVPSACPWPSRRRWSRAQLNL